MDRYIGLDVHSQSCTLVVLGQSGKQLKLGIVETHAEALVAWVTSIAGQKHLCMEEGTQSGWLYEVLRPHVYEIVVVQPAKRTGPKSDERDARELADLLRTGARVRSVYKATGPFTVLRHAVRAHRMLVKDVTRVKNRIKAIYRSVGIDTDDQIYDPESRAPFVEELPEAYLPITRLLNQELDALAPLRTIAEPWIGGPGAAEL